jgi:mannosyltransferase OCH1-like enzyme
MQTWKTRDIPDRWLSGYNSIRKLNPDWEYTLMTDDDNLQFVKDHFPQYVSGYNALWYPIMRADAIRYMYLYLYGGIYIDLDFICHKSFNELLKSVDTSNDIFLRRSFIGPSNDFLMSKPYEKFWLECLEDIFSPLNCGSDGRWACMLEKHQCILDWTGPGLIKRRLSRTRLPVKWQYLPEGLFPSCDLCKMCNVNDTQVGGSIASFLEGNSWVDNDVKAIRNIVCNYHINPYNGWIAVMLLIVIVFLVIILR